MMTMVMMEEMKVEMLDEQSQDWWEAMMRMLAELFRRPLMKASMPERTVMVEEQAALETSPVGLMRRKAHRRGMQCRVLAEVSVVRFGPRDPSAHLGR